MMLWLQCAPRDLLLSHKHEIYPDIMIIMDKDRMKNFNMDNYQVVVLDQGVE